MKQLLRAIRTFITGADILLLFLCTAASVFGIVMITSATGYLNSRRYLIVQIAALIIGLVLYVLFSFIDIHILAERSDLLLAFNTLLISMLFLWGKDDGTGNRSWLAFSWFPVSIQPAEICKITFVIIMARMMQKSQERLSSPLSMAKLTLHLLFTVGLLLAASSDAGNALVFVFLFLVLAYTGGVKLGWFALGFAGFAGAAPFLWTRVMRQDQKNRILMLFDSSIDPKGLEVRWHTRRSLAYIQSGGLIGDGLFHGDQTQSGQMAAQHTDFIFSVIGEELGFLGCTVTLLLLLAIVLRILWVARQTQDSMNRQICVGIAAILVFQILIDVGMCIGVMPVIGLTLPFISYGGSSLVTLFAAMGIVSGIKLRPGDRSGIHYLTWHG